MPPQFSEEIRLLLERAQRAIDRAIELRGARLRAELENRLSLWQLELALTFWGAPGHPPQQQR